MAERNRLLAQQENDEKVYLATQKRLEASTAKLKNPKAEEVTSPIKETSKNNNYDSILKQAQSFHQKLFDLEFEANQASKSNDQKEIDAVKRKYSAILKEFDSLQKKLANKDKGILGSRSNITDSEQKELDALVEKHQKAAAEKLRKETIENLTKAYDEQQKQTELFYADEKDKEAQRFVNKEIDQKTYQANVSAIQLQNQQEQLKNAEQFAKETVEIDGKTVVAVKKAAEDVTVFKRKELEAQTNNIILADKAAEAQAKLLGGLQSQSDHSRINGKKKIAGSKGDLQGEADAEKELQRLILREKKAGFDTQKREGIASIQETGEARKEIEAQIEEDIKTLKEGAQQEYEFAILEADEALMQKRIAIAESFANATLNLFSGLNSLLENIENKKLQREINRNNKQKSLYKDQLDSKLLSQQQYDAKVAALDNDIEQRKKKIAVDQAKRQKALNIFEAIAGTASAVIGALGSKPWGPWNIALAALVGAMGAIQVGVISSQPIPEMGEGGLIKRGPYHKDKSRGLPVINPETGQTELLLEKDEGVIKGAAMRDPKKYSLSGTPSQIASKLNSMHGGVSWSPGAVLRPKFREAGPQIRKDMPQILEQQGIIAPIQNQENLSLMLAALNKMAEAQQELIEETKRQKERLHAVVSIKEYRAMEKKYDNAKKAGSMGQ